MWIVFPVLNENRISDLNFVSGSGWLVMTTYESSIDGDPGASTEDPERAENGC